MLTLIHSPEQFIEAYFTPKVAVLSIYLQGNISRPYSFRLVTQTFFLRHLILEYTVFRVMKTDLLSQGPETVLLTRQIASNNTVSIDMSVITVLLGTINLTFLF